MWLIISQTGNRFRGLIPRGALLLISGMLLLNVLVYAGFYCIGLTLCNNLFVINAVTACICGYGILCISLGVCVVKAGCRVVSSGMAAMFQFFVMIIVSVLLVAGIFLMPAHNAILRGFNTRMNAVDLDAIRQWMCIEEQELKQNGWNSLPESRWPQIIGDLAPRKVEICSFANKDFCVKVIWGSGMMGSFGLIACSAKTEMPLDHKVQQIKISEDIYIFCDK